MASYIVKSTDIARTLQRIEEVVSRSAGNVIAYKRDFIPLLQRPENRRIQHFYYCDDFEGISVRLFDPQFATDNRDVRFRDSRIIFRAGKLGKENGPTKAELLRVWDGYEKPPRGVNTNDPENADKYFGTLNGGSVPDGQALLKDMQQDEQAVLPRYTALWESTCIRGDFFRRMEDTLTKYHQVILEGPPGAGKTWVAREFAKWWTSSDADAAVGSEWQIIQLHESYSYEDFFQGIRPVLLNKTGAEISPDDRITPVGQLVYRYSDGVFRTLCKKAQESRDVRFVLVVDEINRGKTSRVFGELLYLLEYRDEWMILASGERFKVPENVYLIGTMNTADRSIALVDYALRRRFRFIPLKPYLNGTANGTAPVLDAWLQRRQVTNRDEIIRLYCALNRKISSINEHLVVGHSYFMLKSFDAAGPKEFERDEVEQIWEQSVLPLLGEYLPTARSDEIEKDFGLQAIVDASGL
jgi:MoxR-like ATPase